MPGTHVPLDAIGGLPGLGVGVGDTFGQADYGRKLKGRQMKTGPLLVPQTLDVTALGANDTDEADISTFTEPSIPCWVSLDVGGTAPKAYVLLNNGDATKASPTDYDIILEDGKTVDVSGGVMGVKRISIYVSSTGGVNNKYAIKGVPQVYRADPG